MITIFEQFKEHEDYTELNVREFFKKFRKSDDFEEELRSLLMNKVITCSSDIIFQENDRHGKVMFFDFGYTDDMAEPEDNIVVFILLDTDDENEIILDEPVNIYKPILIWHLESDMVKYNL